MRINTFVTGLFSTSNIDIMKSVINAMAVIGPYRESNRVGGLWEFFSAAILDLKKRYLLASHFHYVINTPLQRDVHCRGQRGIS